MRLAIPIQNIRKIIDYLYNDEEDHFYENYENLSAENAQNHIFYDIMMVRNWLFILEANKDWKTTT